MLMRHPAFKDIGHDERGFTLIETLVAAITGIVVVGALFAILEVSLHQTTRVSDYAQASQLGRTTMTRVVNQLHSACLAPGFAPVLAGSTASELRFVNAYSSAAEIPSAQEHRIKFENGLMTDTSRPSTATSKWPSFVFEEKPTVTRIGERLEQSEGESGKPEPVFQYYKYATASNGGEEERAGKKVAVALGALTPISGTELSSSTAKEAAAVLISFRTLPSNGSKQPGRSTDLNTQVVFAFSAPGTESTIKASPCQ